MPTKKFHKFLPVLLAVSAIALGIHAAWLREVPKTEPDQVVEVAPGIYFRHGDLKGHGHCNNGFIFFKEFVLVVDGNFPSGAEACLADIRKLTDKPVRFVFDTHHHGDHSYGNPVWMANGIIPVAHENVCREMARLEPQRWQEAAKSREDVRKLGRDTPMPPIITYPDKLVIDDGAQRVELLHFGTAHTRGDGFAYLPRQRVLFTGDAVVNGPYNYMGDGNSHHWIKVIEALEQLDVEVVAPGHGPLGDRSLLSRQKAFFLALHAEVEKGIAAGKSAEELRDLLKLPEAVEDYAGDFLRDQITKVYAEKIGLEMPFELEELGLVPGPLPARGDPGWTSPQKVVCAGPALAGWAEDLKRVAPGVQIVFPKGSEALLKEVAEADAVIGMASKEIIAAGKKLRWVHSVSAGVDPYIGLGTEESPGIPDLVNSKIILTNGRRCYGPDISDQVFGYILAFSRQLKASIEGKQAAGGPRLSGNGELKHGGFWRAIDPGESRPEWELRGKAMLIVGAGGIGSEVARRAAAFGLEVTAADPDVKAAPPGVNKLIRPADLLRNLAGADVVVIACPLTRSTHRFFGKEHFSAMKKGAIFINVARGPIVEKEALAAALESGKLAGAALDVTEPEPLPDGDPLWKLPNLIITPHNAGQSDGVSRRRMTLARENLRRFAAGEPLLNVVDKQKGY
ncbi:MAG: MBL fold metallo-hydrolase [Planctomycetes bacterium]|nr:MBL fold metallo-hydrolase [Planctomycetota bacterium]